MGCLEWVIIILVLGFVSMLEVCVIATCIGRVLDTKLKVRTETEYKIFRAEMAELKDLVVTVFKAFDNKEEKEKMEKWKIAKTVDEKATDSEDDWLKL